MLQVNRQAQVIMRDLDSGQETSIQGIRIMFRVEKTRVLNTVDSAVITLFNLAQSTRNQIDDGKIQDGRVWVQLNVGYAGDTLTHLFEGSLRSYAHEYQGPNVLTKMTVYDGDDVAMKHVKVQGQKNVTPKQLVDQLMKRAGLKADISTANLPDLQKKLASGYAQSAAVKHILDDICTDIGADWTIQNGIVKITSLGGYVEGSFIYLDETCGLIASPIKIDDITSKTGKQKKKFKGYAASAPGFMVRCLLNSRIKPMTLMHIKSERVGVDADVVVAAVTHDGDTHSQQWESSSRVNVK